MIEEIEMVVYKNLSGYGEDGKKDFLECLWEACKEDKAAGQMAIDRLIKYGVDHFVKGLEHCLKLIKYKGASVPDHEALLAKLEVVEDDETLKDVQASLFARFYKMMNS